MIPIRCASSLIKDKRSITMSDSYYNFKIVNENILRYLQIKNNVKKSIVPIIMVIFFVNASVDYCLQFTTEENT